MTKGRHRRLRRCERIQKLIRVQLMITVTLKKPMLLENIPHRLEA